MAYAVRWPRPDTLFERQLAGGSFGLHLLQGRVVFILIRKAERVLACNDEFAPALVILDNRLVVSAPGALPDFGNNGLNLVRPWRARRTVDQTYDLGGSFLRRKCLLLRDRNS